MSHRLSLCEPRCFTWCCVARGNLVTCTPLPSVLLGCNFFCPFCWYSRCLWILQSPSRRRQTLWAMTTRWTPRMSCHCSLWRPHKNQKRSSTVKEKVPQHLSLNGWQNGSWKRTEVMSFTQLFVPAVQNVCTSVLLSHLRHSWSPFVRVKTPKT